MHPWKYAEDNGEHNEPGKIEILEVMLSEVRQTFKKICKSLKLLF